MLKTRIPILPALLLLLAMSAMSAAWAPLRAQDEGTRLLRYPDVSRDKIAFAYGGDLWVVETAGGTARRLTSHPGEELFPKFSPDGRSIAFTGEYGGTRQVFVIPVDGGTPRQLTFYNDIGELPPRGGYDNQVLDWTPDGKRIVFRANRLPYDDRLGRPYTVPAAGGMEEPMRVPESGTGMLSGDGTKFVYTPIARDFRTWKRHRGGRAPDVWIYDLAKDTAERLTDSPAVDTQPVWMGGTVYFASDREHTLNLFSLDPATHAVRKVTDHRDWDVLWPSAGPDKIVYESGGWLWLFDPATSKTGKVPIRVYGDLPATVPTVRSVRGNVDWFQISPTGKRALLAARGDVYTVPAAKGEVRNLTQTPGIREIDPAWSPDGRWVAYLSDRSGEYEVYVRPSDGGGEERRVTTDGDVWRFSPAWSPDSKKIAFGDKKLRLRWVDVATGRVTEVDASDEDDLDVYRWSPDSRFLAYEKTGANRLSSIWVYSLDERKARQLTGGSTNDFEPVWDPKGRFLYFLSNRDFNLTVSGFEFQFLYTDPTRVYVGMLAKDGPALFLPESDEEEPAEATPVVLEKATASDLMAEAPKPKEKKGAAAAAESEGEDRAAVEPVRVRIDFDGFEQRVRAVPGDSGDYRTLSATADGVLYLIGQGDDTELRLFDLGEQEEKKVLEGIEGYELSADGKKLLFSTGEDYGFADVAPDQKADENLLDLDKLQAKVVPREEWAQMYRDAWRIERDWFYDPGMHGLDWKAVGEKYGQLLPHMSHRSDLDFILGELGAELSAGHVYVDRSSDESPVERVDGALLGADVQPDPSGYYRIAKIFPGENWHEDFRSPLTEPGVHAGVGELILAVDGRSTKGVDNFYRLLEGKGDRVVTLLLNARPTPQGAHEERVQPITNEQNLRYLDWVQANRERVEKASGGRIGYIHLPNTAEEGSRELFKNFYPQAGKDALILDDRYNGGGFIPNNMIALLSRPLLNYWVRRGLQPDPTPDFVSTGPKVCLINGAAGSGGDAFPYYFKKLGLGPLIGTRTWGGLIGLSGNPSLMDGGTLTTPSFRFLDTSGHWAVENEGVAPDIEVIDAPDAIAKGHDPSLERAIDYLLKELEKNPPVKVTIPPVPKPRE